MVSERYALEKGFPANEHYNQYVVKESHKVINAIERMFPVNVKKRTIAVYSLIKNLPVIRLALQPFCGGKASEWNKVYLWQHFGE